MTAWCGHQTAITCLLPGKAQREGAEWAQLVGLPSPCLLAVGRVVRVCELVCFAKSRCRDKPQISHQSPCATQVYSSHECPWAAFPDRRTDRRTGSEAPMLLRVAVPLLLLLRWPTSPGQGRWAWAAGSVFSGRGGEGRVGKRRQ